MEDSDFTISWRSGLVFLLFVIGIIVIILVASQSTKLEPGKIVVAIIAGSATLTFGMQLYRHIKPLLYFSYFWKEEDRQREVVSLDFNIPIPDKLLEIATEIEQYGFTKLGVKERTFKNNLSVRIWLWIDETKTIFASIAVPSEGKPFAGFETCFLDGFLLGTFYERAVALDTKHVWWQSFNSSIGDAHDYHMHQYDEQIRKHGQIKLFKTLADTILDEEERKRQTEQVNQAFIQTLIPSTIYTGMITIGFLTATVLAFVDIYKSFFFMFLTFIGLIIFAKAVQQNTPQSINHKSRKVLEH